MDEIAAERRAPQPIEIERGGSRRRGRHRSTSICPTASCCGRDIALAAGAGKPAADHRRFRARQEHLAARHRRSVAVRAGAHPGGRRALPVSAAAALSAARHPGRRSRLSASSRRAAARRALPRRCAPSACPSSSTGSTRRAIGRSGSRSASSSGSAFARVLLARPEIVFLDEATSALDEAAEMSLYRLLREAPWRPTIVSVGHHGTLRRFHDTVVDLARAPGLARRQSADALRSAILRQLEEHER